LSETKETENLLIEKVEIAGDIINEPILSKSIRELNLGSKHRKISIGPFFCPCGKAISKENAVRCSHCKKLLCRDCGISYLNEIHCKECLKAEHDIFLTKTDYMILLCVSHGIGSAKKIFRLTGVKPEAVKKIIQELMEKYVTKEPCSFLERLFPKLRLTNLGQDALGVFDVIYAKDADCVKMKQTLLEFLAEKAERSYSLRT
jgi:phage FluMu protein Com